MIANVLQECDKEINMHHQKMEAIIKQKKGLMQRLLTGEVRVKA
jgi:type I restriction enzyme S subunit